MAFMQARKGGVPSFGLPRARRHGFHGGPQRGSSKLWFAEVSGGLLHCDYYVVFCPIVGGAY